jgi:membrane protease YdiL (CAAX protease family)
MVAGLAILIATAAYWFRLLPGAPLTDLGFIALMAAPILFRSFTVIYPSFYAKVPTELLGHLMWIQVGIVTVMNERKVDPDFGFWPAARHWRIGAMWYLISLVPVAAISAGTGLVHFAMPQTAWKWIAGSATFFGFLWVVALSEEFFFRGLLQRWIEEWSGSAAIAIGVASVLFGAAHLGYQHFPNWRMALAAAVAGASYGLAYRQTKSMRASMVSHALLVTTWRMFFR